MKKLCEQCKKEFEKKPSMSVKRWETMKYCSHKCYWKSLKGKNLFGDKHNNIPWNKGKKLPQYSGENNPNWKPKVTLTCESCGKKFKVVESKTLEYDYRGKRKFCSRECFHNTQNKTPEHKRIKWSNEYKDWRESVYERDDYTCQECGQKGGKLNPHHIKPFAFFPELRFEINNGLTLCAECHRKTDTYGVNSWRSFKRCEFAGEDVA